MHSSPRPLHRILVVGLIAISLTGCGDGRRKVPYGDEVAKKYNLTDGDMKNLQFYTSGTIVLSRKAVANQERGHTGGALVERQGIVYEVIRIPAGTPCLCIGTKSWNENSGLFNLVTKRHSVMHMEFEPGTALNFQRNDKGAWVPRIESGNVLYFTFENNEWVSKSFSPETKLDDAFLLVTEDSLKKVERRETTLKGSTLPGEG